MQSSSIAAADSDVIRNPLWKRLPGQLIVDGNAPAANSPIPMRPLLSICKQGGGGDGATMGIGDGARPGQGDKHRSAAS